MMVNCHRASVALGLCGRNIATATAAVAIARRVQVLDHVPLNRSHPRLRECSVIEYLHLNRPAFLETQLFEFYAASESV